MTDITAEQLGNGGFKKDYGLRYAYLAGAMYKGIASKELVIAMGKAGMMGFLGTGGLDETEIGDAIRCVKARLTENQPYGANLVCNLQRPEEEERAVELFVKHEVPYLEAGAFLRITPSLVRWRVGGLPRGLDGALGKPRRILAKLSRPEVAAAFMHPAPTAILTHLLAKKQISSAEAELAQRIPMAEEICVEADSAGHTDRGVAYALMPTVIALRDEIVRAQRYDRPIRIGAAGGIGTPHAATGAFMMGADFILTGSINQCTVEAGTSDAAKDLLQEMNIQDTDYAPAGDMFEIGAQVQVARRGLFFASRARKLYELYQRHSSIDEIDPATQQQIQERYFKRSFEEVWRETRAYYMRVDPDKVLKIERNPKHKMALIFRWYFIHSNRLALLGSEDQKVDYQIHCGPAMGAFNQWVKGTELQPWRNRHVANIGLRIMEGAADMINKRYAAMCGA